MSATRAVVFALCAATGLATSVSAQTYDKRTTYTFNTQVELPGMTLPPGDYLFRLADPDSGRQVLQVASTDGKKIYGMFFSMPIEATEAPSKSEVRFMEAAPGSPLPIRAVWYMGERTEREFIYPKRQAMRLAKAAKEPVLTTAGETTTPEETKAGDLARIEASGQAEPAMSAPVAMAAVQGGAAIIPARQAPRALRTSLPKTATDMPLVGLTAMCLLGLAGAFRIWRQSVS